MLVGTDDSKSLDKQVDEQVDKWVDDQVDERIDKPNMYRAKRDMYNSGYEELRNTQIYVRRLLDTIPECHANCLMNTSDLPITYAFIYKLCNPTDVLTTINLPEILTLFFTTGCSSFLIGYFIGKDLVRIRQYRNICNKYDNIEDGAWSEWNKARQSIRRYIQKNLIFKSLLWISSLGLAISAVKNSNIGFGLSAILTAFSVRSLNSNVEDSRISKLRRTL